VPLGMHRLHLLSFSVSYQSKCYCVGPIPINQAAGFGANSPFLDSNEPMLTVSITREPHFINLTWFILKTQFQNPQIRSRFKPATKQLVFACICCVFCFCRFQSHTNLSLISLLQSQPTQSLVLEPAVPLRISMK